jgi:hypothetical protein
MNHEGPLRVVIECQHLSGERKCVNVYVAKLEGLTAEQLKQQLQIKLRGELPVGYLAVSMAGQPLSDAHIQLEDNEDIGDVLPLATNCYFCLGRSKRAAEEYRASVFARAREMRDQGFIQPLDVEDTEIASRVREHRFQSVLRVKMARGKGSRKRTGLDAVISPPPRIK